MSRKIYLKMDKNSRTIKPKANHFSDRLQKVLDEKGLNRHQFAKKLKVSYSRVTDWIEGNGKPSQKNLYLISDKLGVDPAWLLTGRGDMLEEKIESHDIITHPSKEIITSIASEMVKLGAGVDEARAIYEKLKGIVTRIRERRMSTTKHSRETDVVSFRHEDLLTVMIEAMEHLEDDDLKFVHKHIALLLRRRESQRSAHE